ncbi:MAG: hypothetical protein ACLGHN_02205 [Bacteriovoracia bacterium]
MKKSSFVILVMLLAPSAFAERIPGQQLLEYFSANCQSQGEWTRSALGQSIALIESLRSISNDEDCKSVGGSIAQLGLLNQQLTNLANTNETQSRIAEINAQEQELLIQVSNSSDPDTLAAINAKLRDLQVVRAGLIGRDDAQRDLATPDKVSALTNVIQIANTTFSQITSNQTCLNKHPTILKSATSIMSAVGATTAVINPALGIGLMAGSEFLGNTIEGIRRNYSSRMIRRISDDTVAQEAYKCALESMSDKFCQMQDAEAFLDFKERYRHDHSLNSELASAIRLNERELPVLIDWLNKIRSGVTPTTTADAQRQNVVFARETFIRSREATGFGLIAESRVIFDNSEEKDRWSIIRTLVYSLLPHAELHYRNPFFEIYSDGYAPFYLLGLPDDASIRQSQSAGGGYYNLDNWPGKETYKIDFDAIKSNYENWVARARVRVNQELTQVLQPDALQTLTSAYDRSGNRWKVSPMDSLKKLIEFIETNPPAERDYAFRKLYISTFNKLKQIYETTEDAIIRRENDYLNNNTESVKEIYDVAQLQYGTVVIEARLDMIVRLSLLELLRNSPEEDQILVAQLLAAERFTETISKVKGTENIALIRSDLYSGREITMSNLDAFASIFWKNINRILQKLKYEEETSSGTIARSKRYSRTEMCFLLLGVPNLNQYVSHELCEGLQMKSRIAGGPETFKISREVFEKDISERACEYREFFRRSKIYDTWGIK